MRMRFVIRVTTADKRVLWLAEQPAFWANGRVCKDEFKPTADVQRAFVYEDRGACLDNVKMLTRGNSLAEWKGAAFDVDELLPAQGGVSGAPR